MISTDFDNLFKIIKIQEDNYLRLNEIVAKIVHNRAEIEENIFIHDEIIQYKQII